MKKKELCEEFSDILLPISFTALFGKSNHSILCAIHSIKHLSYIVPEKTFPLIYEKSLHGFFFF
jgi:hypothetical protein